MKFFFGFFAAATVLCLYFLLTDSAGSGMGWAVGIFGALAVGTGGFNWVVNGSPLAEGKSLNDQNKPQ